MRFPAGHSDTVSEADLLGFLKSLASLGGLLRAATVEGLQILIELRPSGERVLLDLSREPVRVLTGRTGLEGTAGLAASLTDLGDLFSGRLRFVDGFGERRLLLKGSMNHLVMFYPILALTPVLFAEFLLVRDEQKSGPIRRALGWFFRGSFGALAWLTGWILRGFDRSERLEVLTAMARAVGRSSLEYPCILPRQRPAPSPNLLDPPPRTWLRSAWVRTVTGAAATVGLLIGILRYRARLPFPLFTVLGKLSRAVGAAGPARFEEIRT